MARMCLAQGIKQMADLINCPEAGLFFGISSTDEN